jgi:RNA polymerase sigma-70 factor (ECF subfamily)
MDKTITIPEFESLFREYYTRLYYFAYDFVEDIETAKDIVSEVFAAVWNSRHKMESASVTGYLFISVRNQCLNHLRKKRKAEEYMDFYRHVADEENVEDWKALEDRLSEMAEVIGQMSPRTRYVLEACYFHSKKYKEVAESLDISAEGVKKHIVKAFSLLRAHFNVKKRK